MTPSHFAAARYYLLAYLPVAITVTYLPIWLVDQGIGENEIGLINTLPMCGLLAMGIFVGRLADQAPDWKRTIAIGHGIAALVALLLWVATGFWQILAVWTLTTLAAGLVNPVADAATIRLSLRQGFSFGSVRALGTVGYLVMCVAAGFILDHTGPDGFVWLFVACCIARFAAAAGLPAFRDAGETRRAGKGGAFLSRELLAALPLWVLLPIVGGAMLYGNHMVMNAFSALVWKQQGISEGGIGILIGIGGVAEAIAMFAWQKINARLPARVLILIGGVAALFRWGLMAFELPYYAICILQLGQALTFSIAFLGCIYFIAKRTDEATAAEAQSLFVALQQVFSIGIITLFGLVYAIAGISAFWVMVGLALLALGMIAASLRLHGPDPAG
jgi:Arabinose efflux permease